MREALIFFFTIVSAFDSCDDNWRLWAGDEELNDRISEKRKRKRERENGLSRIEWQQMTIFSVKFCFRFLYLHARQRCVTKIEHTFSVVTMIDVVLLFMFIFASGTHLLFLKILSPYIVFHFFFHSREIRFI